MSIQRVAIIGAGQMGSGIAHVFALAGYDVLLNDISVDRIEAGIASITGNLNRQAAKSKITEAEREKALGQIHIAASLNNIADVDMVIEAATENEVLKVSILKEVCAVIGTDTIIASNTSSIPRPVLAEISTLFCVSSPITSSIWVFTRSGSAAGRSTLFSTGTISWSTSIA